MVVAVAIQVLLLFSLIHCAIKEKDNTKRLFWILTIFVTGSFGPILYIFHRIPTRRREEKDPEFNSTIEYRIMEKLAFKRKPGKKMLFKRRWNKKFRFISYYSITIILLIGMMISMGFFIFNSLSSPEIDSENGPDPFILAYTLLPIMIIIIPIALMSPFNGWNRILVEGFDKKDLIRLISSKGYEPTKYGYRYQMKGGPSIVIQPLVIDDEINLWLKKQGITLVKKKNVIMMVSVETVRNGSHMKLREPKLELPLQMKIRPTEEFISQFKDLKGVKITDLTYSKKKKIGGS
jgi:hypothetical protein